MLLLALFLAVSTPPPNVVVVMSDDLSFSTLNDAVAHGWMPNLQAEVITPGITFTNHFATDALCAPSRATFLTGQHSHNHGVRTNALPLGGVTVLDDSSTVATWLQAAGYRTGLVGKYLNGYGLDLSPSPKDDPTYIPPGWDDWQAVTVPDKLYDYTINDNGTLVMYGSAPADYGTDVTALRAVDFINEAEASDAQPFFLLVSAQAPHQETGFQCSLNVGSVGPLLPAPRHVGVTNGLALPQSPSFNEASVTDKPTWLKNNYTSLTTGQQNCLRTAHRNRVGSLLALDDLVGVVAAALQANGETADTLLMFVSDNGFLLGEHRVNSKQHAYEESIRLPLYARVPGFTGPATATQLVLNTDIAPTLVELAGATAGLVLDGRSLVPIFQDPSHGPWRTHFLIEHEKHGGLVVPPSYSAARSTQYKWVEYVDGGRELYDLGADAAELASQHGNAAYVSIKTALKLMLGALKTCAGTSCWQ